MLGLTSALLFRAWPLAGTRRRDRQRRRAALGLAAPAAPPPRGARAWLNRCARPPPSPSVPSDRSAWVAMRWSCSSSARQRSSPICSSPISTPRRPRRRRWLLEPHPALMPALPNTLLLVASSFAAHFGQRAIERQERGRALVALGAAVIAGTVFALVQLHEWSVKTYTLQTSSYSSLYFVTTGAHMAHVVVGLGDLCAIFGWTAAGYLQRRALASSCRPGSCTGTSSTSSGCASS